MQGARTGGALEKAGVDLPLLLTAEQVADLLQTTRAAIYIQVSRGQLPGVVKLNRRCLRFRRDILLAWLDAKGRAPSLNR
jgi:predicted DNA-binding transcriptional regulator AlpA